MIIQFTEENPEQNLRQVEQLLSDREIAFSTVPGASVIVTAAADRLDQATINGLPATVSVRQFDNDYQLSTRDYQNANTVVDLGDGVIFGDSRTVFAVGPCAVESESQAMKTAEFLTEEFGLKLFRAGAFKPRTSPYSFQGLGEEGLRILDKVRSEFGMKIITEVKDTTHLDAVAEVADIVQVGTKAMYNPALLIKCGQLQKPICLKRGFMATVKEFLQAADFIMSQGNMDVILCERGIRSFEPQTRFCLDICAAALVQTTSHLPLMLDPSHAMGYAAQVPAVARAAAGMGVDSLMIEIHPDPPTALSDKSQALSFEQFRNLYSAIKPICQAAGRNLV